MNRLGVKEKCEFNSMIKVLKGNKIEVKIEERYDNDVYI